MMRSSNGEFWTNSARILLSVVLFFSPEATFGWSLKTHVWIAQEVLNDVTDDGRLELAGSTYAVPPAILDALQNFPGHFRTGNLGPDVFPDPIVGQTTTHAGVDGGWQTDQWLAHVLSRAADSDDIAYAYGFVAHAAADTFAHTYVNAYAGDIFLLTDREREVERRHFVLEKYVEGLTPQPRDLAGATITYPAALQIDPRFASSTFILNRKLTPA